ncbi:MAG: phage holin family protein [bacterium]
MPKSLIKLIANACFILLIASFIPGITVSNFYIAVIVAIVLALANVFLRPILVLLTLPINLVTFGCFTFFINAFIFWLTGTFIKGFTVQGLWPALLGSLVLSVLQSILDRVLESQKTTGTTYRTERVVETRYVGGNDDIIIEGEVREKKSSK